MRRNHLGDRVLARERRTERTLVGVARHLAKTQGTDVLVLDGFDAAAAAAALLPTALSEPSFVDHSCFYGFCGSLSVSFV